MAAKHRGEAYNESVLRSEEGVKGKPGVRQANLWDVLHAIHESNTPRTAEMFRRHSEIAAAWRGVGVGGAFGPVLDTE
jgi:hypothetical protein